jgi:hypothetical protein
MENPPFFEGSTVGRTGEASKNVEVTVLRALHWPHAM